VKGELTGIAHLAMTVLESKLPSQFKGLASVSDPLWSDRAGKTNGIAPVNPLANSNEIMCNGFN
jgi:hypothetical protein